MCAVEGVGIAFDGYSDSKLFKVNFTSLSKCKTIEFRQHGGTSDYDSLKAWMSLVLAFCKAATRADAPFVTELAQCKAPLNALFYKVLNEPDLTQHYLKRMGVVTDLPLQQFETLPIFLYGSLMSPHFRSSILTGDAHNYYILPDTSPATLRRYRRGTVFHKDYPALVFGTDADCTDGLLFAPRNMDDRRKLNDFEGEQYKATIVHVESEGERIAATAYVWAGDDSDVSDTWNFKKYESERLPAWLDLFDGMDFL
jgi:hypothetical protein